MSHYTWLSKEAVAIVEDQDKQIAALRAELAASEAECDRLREAYDDVRVLNVKVTAATASQCVTLRAELAAAKEEIAKLVYMLTGGDQAGG